MSSDRRFQLVTLALSLVFTFLLSGCDKFLKGRNPDPTDANVIAVSTKEIDCIKQTPRDLQDFFADRADRAVVSKTVSCVQHSLQVFMRLTRGKVAEGYKAQEVQFFFNRNLIGEHSIKISDEFLAEIMKLKVVAVGGTLDFVSRLELEQFIDFLSLFEKEIVRIQGFMKLLSFKADRAQYEPQQLAVLQAQMKALNHFVLKKTKLTGSRYQFKDFVSFLAELQKFVGTNSILAELLRWMPLAETVKNAFVGENARLVSESEWSRVADWSISAYISVLRFHYEIRGRDASDAVSLKEILPWVDEIFDRVGQSPAMKDQKIIETAALDRLLDQLSRMRLLRFSFLGPTDEDPALLNLIKSTYRKALGHFLGGSSETMDPWAVNGFTESQFQVLKHEYTVWKVAQLSLIEAYSQNGTQNLRSLHESLSRFELPTLASASPPELESLKRSWEDYKKLLFRTPGIVFDGKLKTHVSYRMDQVEIPFSGATMMNSIRSAVRLLMRGYGHPDKSEPFDRQLSREKLVALQGDFQDFAVAMHFIDPRVKDSAAKTFDQGDLLGYHSDGNGWLSAIEVYEMLSFMISGGRTQLNEIYKDLETRQCLRSGLDVFKRPFVDEACFYKAFQQRFMTYFDHIPGTVYFMKSLNDSQWAQFFHGLLAVSKSAEHVEGQLESPEIRTMTTALDFIEALIRTYDRDQNIVLNESEVASSLPRFGPFISKLSPAGNMMIEDILLFLVYEGRKPTLPELGVFAAKRRTPFFRLGEVDRMHLVKLLSILKQGTAPNENSH